MDFLIIMMLGVIVMFISNIFYLNHVLSSLVKSKLIIQRKIENLALINVGFLVVFLLSAMYYLTQIKSAL